MDPDPQILESLCLGSSNKVPLILANPRMYSVSDFQGLGRVEFVPTTVALQVEETQAPVPTVGGVEEDPMICILAFAVPCGLHSCKNS